jgi:hypothetical protein
LYGVATAARGGTGRDIGTDGLAPLSPWAARHRPLLILKRLSKSLVSALFLMLGMTTAGRCSPVTAGAAGLGSPAAAARAQAADISLDQGVVQGFQGRFRRAGRAIVE